ncbi:uncharacterized protein M421DRAFT_424723 [Didymella exigua CBS 183.55]|uniref:Transcription initiation factor TFIID subunit 8 n=1 Tax=Didymella exigua CBS 183.55 TaxID=1150837 RepID=A0A6A5RB73_9PLEO|nr:uncharacterized protein M421DRAFT_424723 [Didymella exigua CBS 183.55]KAF1924589.1 hypothetical protein M421DRAFT_424723 [Didymella exigua CBS 183.55]
MPGLISPSSASSGGAIAAMKRPHDEAGLTHHGAPLKKRKVVHQLHHTQPVQYMVDPISTEFDFGDSKDFYDQQLRRAIAIHCKTTGFDSARPDALEEFRGLVDSYMTKFLANVRMSMTSARRTETVAHDWIYALGNAGLAGSGLLEQRMDTGEVPKSLLQPHFDPPAPPEPQPISTDSLLGPELSGRTDKEARAYIPKHFPPFPSKNTYKATPVFTSRENDPRKIREKATEEGILAEQSLRKLMAAQKAGIQKQTAGKRKRSTRMRESDRLWQEAMTDLLHEEKEHEKSEARQRAREEEAEMEADDDSWNAPLVERQLRQPIVDRNVNLEEGVHVNYDQRFWRKSARGA